MSQKRSSSRLAITTSKPEGASAAITSKDVKDEEKLEKVRK